MVSRCICEQHLQQRQAKWKVHVFLSNLQGSVTTHSNALNSTLGCCSCCHGNHGRKQQFSWKLFVLLDQILVGYHRDLLHQFYLGSISTKAVLCYHGNHHNTLGAISKHVNEHPNFRKRNFIMWNLIPQTDSFMSTHGRQFHTLHVCSYRYRQT